MNTVECLVIGAGVIGLAVARALAIAGQEVIIVEREDTIGSGVSSRSSEVIHAGIYYPANSLRARFCVEGRHRLYAYCRQRHIPHRACGKFIVATSPDQVPALETIANAARRNGVCDIEHLTAKQAQALEPQLTCLSALNSPSTGIIDSHAYMLSLLGDAEGHGAVIAYRANVSSLRAAPEGPSILFEGDAAPSLRARLVVNAAGLDAPVLTQRTEGLDPAFVRRGYYAKGNYFTLVGRAPFSRLVYPAPEPGGLGVHLTLDLAGQARFGPDVEWIETPNYDVDPHRAQKFYAAVRAYWPGLRDGALAPAYAGVRPKLSGPGDPPCDFQIEGPRTHGVRGLINLLGIESPGLTSSLAIADHVAAMAEECLNA